jgi:tetratricopeptide (TPR) repeat protein
MKIQRRTKAVILFAFLTSAITSAIASDKDKRAPVLMAGLGEVHHPVSTKNPQAQQFFDQGLKLVFGFNHDEARRSFQRAAELDPKLAIAWWGVALTLGPNYNLPVDPEREKAGYEAAQRALALQANASEPEKAYINAVAVRYSNDPKADLPALDVAYKEAMGKLSARYPDDLDAATLYAESAMNLHPWHLWSPDGKPNAGTEEIVAVLESVLKRNPDHLGANHYYIHAVEASLHPERALPSAQRLEKLAPAAGHLVHMPAHIYARLGDHAASAKRNEVAAAADEKYIKTTGLTPGVYSLMYYSHNLHFLAYAACMDGSLDEAKKAAARLVANVSPHVKEMPMLEGFLPAPMLVLVAFERWDDILRLPAPDASLGITNAIWHFARGVAQAAKGNLPEAEREQNLFREGAAKIPADATYDMLNKTADVVKVPDNLLTAAIARAKKDSKTAIDTLNKAVAAEDALNYSEPPSWFPTVRPLLGRVLLAERQLEEAEKVFRADLDRSPRDGRALAGLRDTLKAQGRDYEAAQLDQQYRASWKTASAATSSTSH